MVSNELEQLSSEALEAARICANKYVRATVDLVLQKLAHRSADILSKSLAKKASISASVLILTMSFVSIRCCHVPVRIDFKPECGVLGASPTELLLA